MASALLQVPLMMRMQGIETRLDLVKWITGYRALQQRFLTSAFMTENAFVAHLLGFHRTFPAFLRRAWWTLQDVQYLLDTTQATPVPVNLSAHLDDPALLRRYVTEIILGMGLVGGEA